MSNANEAHNASWWIVAHSEEIVPGKLFAVMCSGDKYVLFRDASGVLRALIDQCAHRRAPLSLGRITAEGWVECPYHGWRFNGESGSCMSIPNLSAAERVPAYQVEAFAVEERDGFVHLYPRGLGSNKIHIDTLALEQKPLAWHASQLIAYPHRALVDLLLDAPSAVLQIPYATILSDHRYGEPAVTDTAIEIRHAVAWTPRGKPPKQNVHDFPLELKLEVNHSGQIARAELSDNAGDVLVVAHIGLTPVATNLTSVHWRAVGVPYRNKALELGVRRHLSPEAIQVAYAYPSKLCRERAAAVCISAD